MAFALATEPVWRIISVTLKKNICTDPCKDHTCSEGAECVLKDDLPFCQCAEGYTGEKCDECAEGYVAYDSYCALPPEFEKFEKYNSSKILQDSQGSVVYKNKDRGIQKDDLSSNKLWVIPAPEKEGYSSCDQDFYLMKNNNLFAPVECHKEVDGKTQTDLFLFQYDDQGVKISDVEGRLPYRSDVIFSDTHIYLIEDQDTGLTLHKLNFDGTEVWKKEWNPDLGPEEWKGVFNFRRMFLDEEGNILVAGMISTITEGGYADVLIAKFSPEGENIWHKRAGNFSGPTTMDSQGNFYTASNVIKDPDELTYVLAFRRHDKDGNLLFSEEYAPFLVEQKMTMPKKIVLDSQGNIIITGTSDMRLNAGEDQTGPFILKLNPEGEKVWARHFPMICDLDTLFVDPLDRIVITGVTEIDYVAEKFIVRITQPDLPKPTTK